MNKISVDNDSKTVWLLGDITPRQLYCWLHIMINDDEWDDYRIGIRDYGVQVSSKMQDKLARF